MKKRSSIILWFTGGVLVMTALLAIRKVELSAAIVTITILYGASLVCKYGWIWWHRRHSKVAQRERFLLFLASLMILFLATGTALYMWAFSSEGGKFVNAEYLFRSLACSFQLFTANIDSNVLDTINKKQYIKGLISIQAFFSFSCTIAVLISLVYARVKAYIRLHRKTKVDESHNHLFVFFGINEPSKLLAKSIWEKEKGHALIVFVENSHMDEEDQNGWNNIVGFFTHRRQTFMEAEEVNARITFTESKLSDIGIVQNDETDVLGEINLLKLKELIQQLSTTKNSKIHVFFLSENEDENIRAMSTIAMDQTIQQVNDNLKPRFYCHARRNGLNRIVEDIAVKRNLEVHIIDSSYLSVELLKADKTNHPVNLIEVDKDNPSTTKSDFNGLIIGFDEVGQDALKFLYEFGAFVDSDTMPNQVMRSPFHCIAVDKRMDELGGVFSTFSPAAMAQRNKDGSHLIKFKQCDCNSTAFYNNILDAYSRKRLNYVVIAVGDDELGMMLALRILNYIRKDREDLSRLRIYVRSYRSDKETYMQKIANFYNEGYNKDCKKGQQTEAIIIPFGQMEKIYSYDLIINDELTEKGRRYHEGYALLRGEAPTWNERRQKELTKASLDSIRSLRRKESQDLANALHADTKINLLVRSMPDDFGWEDFFNRYYGDENKPQSTGHCNQIKYPYLTSWENKLILNLACLEHIRWIASHEILGYTKADGNTHCCDERTRQHNCLRPWQELDEESKLVTRKEGWSCDYQSYDFGVVDISILLNKEKLLSL